MNKDVCFHCAYSGREWKKGLWPSKEEKVVLLYQCNFLIMKVVLGVCLMCRPMSGLYICPSPSPVPSAPTLLACACWVLCFVLFCASDTVLVWKEAKWDSLFKTQWGIPVAQRVGQDWSPKQGSVLYFFFFLASPFSLKSIKRPLPSLR